MTGTPSWPGSRFDEPRAIVHRLALGVRPGDPRETDDRAETLRWVRSGAPLVRSAAPERHLCVYFALLDGRRVLLVDHVFVLAGEEGMALTVDEREAREVRWFDLADPAQWPPGRFDARMEAFRRKVTA